MDADIARVKAEVTGRLAASAAAVASVSAKGAPLHFPVTPLRSHLAPACPPSAAWLRAPRSQAACRSPVFFFEEEDEGVDHLSHRPAAPETSLLCPCGR